MTWYGTNYKLPFDMHASIFLHGCMIYML